MKKFIQEPAYSLKDFRLLPGYTHEECEVRDISLRSPLCRDKEDFIMLDLPFLSAAMQSVTSVRLATALAELGGVGVIPLGNSIEEQCRKVESVKQYKTGFPRPTADARNMLRVGAAVSTHPEDRERITELIKTGVDFIVIDASDGFTIYQSSTIEWIKENHRIPVIGGNVITDRAFDTLVKAGADAVKVGMGAGSGCITQDVKGTGRGQATAIMEVVKARDAFAASNRYIPVIADGGISSPADIAIALALGADSVMMGNFFARFNESHGREFEINGKKVKEYWMEGSIKGHNDRRYQHSMDNFFEEGVSGFVPLEGSIYDLLPISRKRLVSTFRSIGAASMDDFHRLSVLELQSSMAQFDGRVHGMVQFDI